tara:strand:- start:4085 stop:4510 length:426 start_codon:yes stop_codon:yes gene_type:complete
MERARQVEFCEKCLNRDYSPKKGIICKLTGNQATFTDSCENYSKDEKAAILVERAVKSKEAAETHESTFGLSAIGIKNGVVAGGVITGLGIGSIIFTITMLGFISLWSILIILAGIIAMVKGASINKKKKLKSSYVDLLDD